MQKVFRCEFCYDDFYDETKCELHELDCNQRYDKVAYVAECFLANQTFHENPRFYSIFKKTVIVDDKFAEMVRPLKNGDYERINDLFQDQHFLKFIPQKFSDTIVEKFIMCGDFDEKSVNIIDGETLMDWYSDEKVHPDDDLVCEIHFKNKYKEHDDIGIAFMSVYKIERSKLQHHDYVDIMLRKWVTSNVRR